MHDHPAALGYDCMTLTGRTLAEYADMGAQGLIALSHLVGGLPPESATWRALHEGDEMPAWAMTSMTNALLVELYDQLHLLRAEHAAKGTGKKPRRVKPHPVPWRKAEQRGVGSGGVRLADFDGWWQSN